MVKYNDLLCLDLQRERVSMGIIILIPIAIFLAILCKKRFEEVAFPAIGLITIPMLVSSCWGNVEVGYYLILAVAAFATVYSIICFFRKRALIKKYALTSGMLTFICTIPLFIFISKGRVFTSEDALRYLGPAVKSLFLSSKNVLNDKFFPFTSFWAYLNIKLTGKFSEEMCIFSNNIFIFSSVLPIFRYRKYNKGIINWFVLSLIVVLIPIIKLTDSYVVFDYYAPQMAAIIYVFLTVIDKKYNPFCLAYGVFAAGIFSEYGALQLFPILIFLSAKSIEAKRNRKQLLVCILIGYTLSMIPEIVRMFSEKGNIQNVLIRMIVLPAALAVGMAVLKVIKHIYQGEIKKVVLLLSTVCLGTIIIGGLIIVNNDPVSNWGNQIYEFSELLFKATDDKYLIGRNVIRMSDITFILLSFGLIGVTRYLYKGKERNNLLYFDIINLSVIIGALIYISVIASLWISSMNKNEDGIFPSIAGYTAPIIVILVLLLINNVIMIQGKGSIQLFPVVLMFIIILTYGDPINGIFYRDNEQRIEYDGLDSTRFSSKDKVFFLDKIERGPEAPAEFVWSVFPASTGTIDGFNFNPDPLKYTDKIEKQITYKEITKLVKDEGYSYVYLRNTDENFKENYWPIFVGWDEGIVNDTLYKVEFTSEGYLLLDAIIDKNGNKEGD